jgi:hypothetical protein
MIIIKILMTNRLKTLKQLLKLNFALKNQTILVSKEKKAVKISVNQSKFPLIFHAFQRRIIKRLNCT